MRKWLFLTQQKEKRNKACTWRYLNSRHTNARGTILGTRSNIKSSRILDSSGVSGIREGNIVETRAGSKRGNLWISIRLFSRNEKQIRLVLEQKRLDIGRRG